MDVGVGVYICSLSVVSVVNVYVYKYVFCVWCVYM